jgi:hypothetical protein
MKTVLLKMKWLVFILFTCIVGNNSFAQKAEVINKKEAVLKDKRTNYTYVLDASHTSISAFNNKGKLIWNSFVTTCNYSEEKRRYEIMSMKLDTITKDKKVPAKYALFVSHCMCWGYFELETGQYHGQGCD